MAEQLIYKSLDALKPLENLVDEANQALADPSKFYSKDPHIEAALAAVGGIAVGSGAGFAGLYFLGTTGLSAVGITTALATAGSVVGGGMAAGVAVLAAPAVIIGVAAYATMSVRNARLLQEKKEMLLQEILRKHNAVIHQLKSENQQTQERIDYLNRLNTLLQAAIKDLKGDLSQSVA